MFIVRNICTFLEARETARTYICRTSLSLQQLSFRYRYFWLHRRYL